jgi:hypothetical protein
MKKLMESGALPTDPEKEAREGRQRVEIGDREKKASTSKEAAEEAVDDEDDFFDNE